MRIQTKKIPLMNLNFQQSAIIAPHPDDEVLGCGGLITRLAEKGNAPHVIIMTGGENSHHGCCTLSKEDIVQARHRLTIQAAELLGVPTTHIHCLHYPDGEITLANTEKTVKLRTLLQELGCDAVFIPHWGEGWSDHTRTAQIIKKMNLDNVELYEYCVWMWYYNIWRLDWPNARQLRMTDHECSLKRKAVDKYVIPLAPCGRPWSGKLPGIFLKANRWNRELYFKTDGQPDFMEKR